MSESNTLYYGDNLDILRRYVKDESVDLIYLDPPFKSNQDYNVLFAEKNGSQSTAQIRAFEDTWHWDQSAALAYTEVAEMGGQPSQAMQAFRKLLGDNDMMAYLAMMAPRLVELRRVLNPSGSIYLHCDPTASHYLKILMDSVFAPRHFRTEIIWKRTTAHSDTKQGRKQHGRIHDTLLFYTKSDEWTWNPVYIEYDREYTETSYKHIEPGTGRRYMLDNITGPGGAAKGNPRYEVLGVTRFWRYTEERMQQLIAQGRVVQTKKGNVPRLKRYLDEMPGVPLQDIWTDIKPIASQAAERLGYPTQKPETLLERIIESSSNKGDLVLDPFCGCGTAVAAAEKLDRRWIGIDITHLAVHLIRHRLNSAFGDLDYGVIGEPTSLSGATNLARQDPYQFQYWALGLVGARTTEQKKGADKGIDGRLYFHDEGRGGKTKQIIFSVKAGNTGSAHVRDLIGVLAREKAQIGVLISMQEPTRAMRKEAASAGFYESPWGKHPRIQLLTIERLLKGDKLDYPIHGDVTFKKAPKAKRRPEEEQLLPLGVESPPDYDESE